MQPCLFCRVDASGSKSVEHIVPQSLGNEDHVLPKGVVCDSCNNYFARKIEGPLLAERYLTHARSLMWVPNKRGYVPSMSAVLRDPALPVEAWFNGSRVCLGSQDPADLQKIENSVLSGAARKVVIPIPAKPDRRLMSRFLGKVAIEALASRVMKVEGWREELLTLEALEPLRRYVRRGEGPTIWEFRHRRLYPPDAVFAEKDERFEVLHEFDFVYTADRSLLFVLALFGEEFAIDMGDSSISAYNSWLDSNDQRSPLYPA